MPKKYIYLVYYSKTTSTVPEDAMFFWDLQSAKDFAQKEADDYEVSEELYANRKELGVTSVPMFLFEKSSLVGLWDSGSAIPEEMKQHKSYEDRLMYLVTGKRPDGTTFLHVHPTFELASVTLNNLEKVNSHAQLNDILPWQNPTIISVAHAKFSRKFIHKLKKAKYLNGWYSQEFLDGYYGKGKVKALQLR